MLLAVQSGIGTTLAIIVGVGMAAQWIAWRTQIPSIILLLMSGLALGPLFGVVDPDALLGKTLFPIVSISVALILFEGGLDLPPRELRASGRVVRLLITLGAAITFGIAAWGSEHLFGISRGAAAVMAAVLVVTGPTVVGPLLRFVKPNGQTGAMLRAEGILIDPIGATAALLAFEAALLVDVNEAIGRLAWVMGLTLVVGIGIGFAVGYLLDHAMNRFLVPDHLANPIAMALVIVAFVVSNEIQEEAGLLTVTVIGIWLARRDSAAVRHMLEFQEGIRTVLISALFILLAARIEMSQLRDVALPALAFLALLVFVARPLSVIASTIRSSLSWRERLFLMSMAPRGIVAAAVSAIFAIRLEEENVPGADKIAPVVFLVIIGTIVIYGFAAGPIARRLGLAEAHANGVLIVGAHPMARGLATTLAEIKVSTLLVDTDPYNVTRAVALGLRARRLSVLTDEATHGLDLRGIGRILSLTPNDEVNALATTRFARIFGRRETFQLAPSKKRQIGNSQLPQELLGRVVGMEGLSYEQVDEKVRLGWRVRAVDAGPDAAAAIESGDLVPIAQLANERLNFVCRNDGPPSQGIIVGMVSPTHLERLTRPIPASTP